MVTIHIIIDIKLSYTNFIIKKILIDILKGGFIIDKSLVSHTDLEIV